ncbi:hypothetical protein ACIGZJ_17110 [Kitasatospora sp. NPDC052868]|uniref:hypothetical protein n=1 Tax=Kitasatospora sp. NPDC052868 TaxID=3364060 RepID=UPI0037C83265
MSSERESAVGADSGKEATPARRAAVALIAAHRLLGREAGALAGDEENASSSNDRAATVRRKQGLLWDTCRYLSGAVSTLASVVGLQELGVDGQRPQDASGQPYAALPGLENLDSDLYTVVLEELGKAVGALRKVYVPTRKHPDLAFPEDRAAMAGVVAHLRIAVGLVEGVYGEEDVEEESTGIGADIAALLDELEQICAPLPSQHGEMSDEAVIARVLDDPRLAAKTAKALRLRRQQGAPAAPPPVR